MEIALLLDFSECLRSQTDHIDISGKLRSKYGRGMQKCVHGVFRTKEISYRVGLNSTRVMFEESTVSRDCE